MAAKFYHPFKSFLFLFIPMFFLLQPLIAQPVLTLTPVITSGLAQPIQLVNAGDESNRVFIVEKTGAVKVYSSSFVFLSNFVVVSGITSNGERGLLSMAFHPDYENNGFFYVYYTNTNGDLEIARYQVSANANVADAASKVVVLTIPHPTYANHNGGELHFGSDGYLYLSTGDGGSGGDPGNNAQNTTNLLGKILRINVNTSATPPFYTVPPGNPYSNLIYSLGLRNPFRWSFDRLTGDMWIGDVGQNSYEEINYRAAASTNGANYGWRCYEADNAYNTAGCGAIGNYIFPVYNYPNTGTAAVTGGVVYRGTLSPAIYGWYIAADFYSGTYYLTTPDGTGGWTTLMQTSTATGIADFGETENGEVYVVSLTSNTVSRLNGAPGAPVPVRLNNFTASIVNNAAVLNWKTSLETNLKQFEIEYTLDGNAFVFAGTVAASGTASGSEYTFTHVAGVNGEVLYRLKMKDNNGTYSYSGIVKVVFKNKNQNLVSPSVINNGIIYINIPENTGLVSADLINSDGKV